MGMAFFYARQTPQPSKSRFFDEVMRERMKVPMKQLPLLIDLGILVSSRRHLWHSLYMGMVAIM
jgi:hypothetical protein